MPEAGPDRGDDDGLFLAACAFTSRPDPLGPGAEEGRRWETEPRPRRAADHVRKPSGTRANPVGGEITVSGQSQRLLGGDWGAPSLLFLRDLDGFPICTLSFRR
ncbi:hypothetical protein GCM10020367_67190 [Streptomyces sannanensis]|uniref:Uncharacterized protein n=1 Tax=Streptomyces sannanensis TaxID=285536 RepID=A0ABP6S3X6_9ACTN